MKVKIKERIKEDVEVWEIRPSEGFLHDKCLFIRVDCPSWGMDRQDPKIPALNLNTGVIEMFYSTKKVRPTEVFVEYTV
ncbi:hypothetical protein [Klebsiella phage DP]|nr:hypothetical protein [Klebsiella phage DP]